MELRRPDSIFPNAWARPWPCSLCVWLVETDTPLPLKVAQGEVEERSGPLPLPPQVAVSVPGAGQLLECALGAAINAELIIIAATATSAVLLISLAFMTYPPSHLIAAQHHRFGVRKVTKATEMPASWHMDDTSLQSV